jgi:uncharacterized protein (TIGR02466 family)
MSIVFPAFPTPVYSGMVRGSTFDRVQKEIDDSLSKVDFRLNDHFGETHFLSDPTFKENYFKKHSLDALKDVVDEHLKDYMQKIGYNEELKYRYDSSWVALFKPGNYGHIHDHGSVDISGVYYHKTNGKDGKIFFESPNTNLASSVVFNHLSNSMTADPEEGKIILFPGWFKHGIKRNNTDETRISLSFNIYIDNIRGDNINPWQDVTKTTDYGAHD